MECGLDSIFFLTDNLGKLFEGQYVLASYVLYSDLAQQLSDLIIEKKKYNWN